MAFNWKPKPPGPFRRMIGGLSDNDELSSRLGDASRELLFEPPDEILIVFWWWSSAGIINDRPDAEADLITERADDGRDEWLDDGNCFAAVVGDNCTKNFVPLFDDDDADDDIANGGESENDLFVDGWLLYNVSTRSELLLVEWSSVFLKSLSLSESTLNENFGNINWFNVFGGNFGKFVVVVVVDLIIVWLSAEPDGDVNVGDDDDEVDSFEIVLVNELFSVVVVL